jgi:hypothetical protein
MSNRSIWAPIGYKFICLCVDTYSSERGNPVGYKADSHGIVRSVSDYRNEGKIEANRESREVTQSFTESGTPLEGSVENKSVRDVFPQKTGKKRYKNDNSEV